MRRVLVAIVLALWALSALVQPSLAQVPITVWGYVYMPDGSPAAGASVTVSAGGVSKSTTTDSSGKYEVDLTVPSVPVTVTVTASKGSYRGSASRSNVQGVVRIDITLQPPPPPPPPPKKSTSLSLSTAKGEYVLGEVVTLNGTLSPAMSAEVVITLVCPNATRIRASVQSNSQGFFSFSFKPDRVGAWSAYAEYAGSGEYAGSRSNTVEFKVKQSAALSLFARAEPPDTVVVSGSLSPAAAGVPVMLFVSLDGGKTWLFLCNTTTNELGQYTVTLSVKVAGLMLFKAVFPGSDTLTRAETVQPPAIRLESPEEVSLRESLKACEASRASLAESLKVLNATNAKLQEDVRRLEGEVRALIEEQRTLKNTISTLSSENERLENSVKSYQVMLALAVPAASIASLAAGMFIGKRARKGGQQERH